MLKEVRTGMENIARAANLRHGSASIPIELARLSRRVVQEDKILFNFPPHIGISDISMYLQRSVEAWFIFREVFIRHEYSWQPKTKTPRVIDLGGDFAGISALYWKSVAPRAKVTIIEANPATAKVLSDSLKERRLEDVQVINAAIADEEGYSSLHLHKPGMGYHASDFVDNIPRVNNYQTILVPNIRPSTLIGDEHVDLLKMDIEGAEGAALRDLQAAGKLGQIDEIMMEFHNDPANPTNSLPEVLNILNDAGFSIERAHKSGRARRAKTEFIDLSEIVPSERRLVTLKAVRR